MTKYTHSSVYSNIGGLFLFRPFLKYEMNL